MSEVNNVSSNASFDARINASADSKPQRDSTVQEDGKQSSTQDSSPKSSPQSKNQERRDSAVTEMIKALQQEQKAEDIVNYRQNIQELYRQRNQQASEEYMERLKSTQTEQEAEVVEERKEVKDVHHKYNERVQDLSRKHLSRLLKGKLEDSTFKDLEKVVDPKAAEEKEAQKPADLQKSARSLLNKSNLRPEVSRLIESKAQHQAQGTDENRNKNTQAAERTNHGADAEASRPPKYDLMESALSKLRNRLGGAHQNTQKQLQQSQNAQHNDQIYAQKQPLHHTEAPIRANMGNIQQDIQRSRQLAQAADGSRYVPLENSDIEKLLTQYKIPFTHAMVQTIKQSSQKLQDSSYFFLRAASVLAHTGIEVTPERAELVAESLRLYEKYERPSTMNKLFRYLINNKYLELYKQIKTQDPQRKNQGYQDLGRSLFDAQTGKALSADVQQSSPGKFASLSFRTARDSMGPGGMQLPAGANPEALSNAVKAQLQDLGLPANRVMVRQIVQSAEGDVMRAQALLLQLASGGSLSQAAVDPVYQALQQLPAEAQDAGPLELMKSLNIAIPERLLQSSSPTEQKLAAFLAQLGLPPTRLEGHPQTREALVQLHALADKTHSTDALVEQLSKALTSRSDFWMKQLSRHLPRLTDLNQAMKTPRFGDAAQQKGLARALILAMEMPENRSRSWERVRRVLGELSDRPLKNAAASEGAKTIEAKAQPSSASASTSARPDPEAILARYGKLPFAQLAPLTLQNQAREALLLLHTQAQKLGIEKSFQPMARQLLNGPQALEKLQLLGRLLPQLQRQLQQGFTPTGLQHVVQNLQPERSVLNSGFEQVMANQYPRLSQAIRADAIPLQAAQEALQLLHHQAQVQQQQPQLAQVINGLSSATLPTALAYLTQLLPHLQQQTLSQNLSLEALQEILRTLATLETPTAKVTTPTAAQATATVPESSPFLSVLARFYPHLDRHVAQSLSQQLQQASPDSLKGFFQLHQILGQMDPLKAQSLGSLWQVFSPESAQSPAQGRLLERLAHLSGGLTPLLNATPKGLSQSYALSPAQQNQFIQGLQSFLQSGNTQTLKPVLLELLATPMVTSPLNKVKEQLIPFQLSNLNPGALENIWQLSQGSRLRVDAMAVLLKGNYPLLESNITQMVSLLERLPAQQRANNVHDILLQFQGLSEALPTTLAQMQVRNPLTQLRSLLESPLPLLAQHFNPASTSSLPAQQISVSLNTSPNQLLSLMEQISTQLSTVSAEGQMSFKPVMAAIQNVLQQLNGLIPQQGHVTSLTALQNLQQAIQGLQQTLPQPQAIQNLGQQLQSALGTGTLSSGANSTVSAFQTQLMGFLHELGLLSRAIDQRMGKTSTGTSTGTSTPTGGPQGASQPLSSLTQNISGSLSAPIHDPQGLGLPLSEDPLSAEAIQKYLQQWGLQVQSPEGLQQIMHLMQGQQERLDAVAILLKGNMPLLPAHIQVIAQYVKSLPPQERFQSISKVLSFLSDALIDQMKHELQAQQKSQRQQHFPGLPEDAAETAENHALNARKASIKQGVPFSAQSYTTAAYAAQSDKAMPLPLLQHLLHNGHLPEHFLLPLERMMGQLESLFPRYDAPASLQGLQETLAQLRQALQPGHTQGAALAQWMQDVGVQVQRWDKKLQQQVQQLAQRQGVPFEESNWIESLLASLLGITDSLAQEDPGKAQQLHKLRQNIQEQLQYFKESLQSLAGGQQQLAETPQSALQPLQYIPAYLEQMGLPVEMLIQPEKDETDVAAAENFSEVLLNVKTHTLGDVHLQLRFDTRSQKLSARMGLSSGKLLRHIKPLLASFQERMHALPFEVTPLQTYIIDPAQQQQTVMARRLYRRLNNKAIDAL